MRKTTALAGMLETELNLTLRPELRATSVKLLTPEPPEKVQFVTQEIVVPLRDLTAAQDSPVTPLFQLIRDSEPSYERLS
jgi:hypothetical protein